MDEQPGFKGLNVSKESARSVVPELLHLWLSVLSKGQEAVDDFFNNKAFGETEVDDDSNYCDGIESDESDDDTDSEDEEDNSNVKVN